MNMTFKGTFDATRYAEYANTNIPFNRDFPIPSEIHYAGHVNMDDDPYHPTFYLTIGDYVIVAWRPSICAGLSATATFNRTGSYTGARVPGKPHLDNLRAEDLKVELFRHAVGHTWVPTSVEDASEVELPAKRDRDGQWAKTDETLNRVTIKVCDGEYRIPGPGNDREEEACYTNDRQDAIDTCKHIYGRLTVIKFRRVSEF